MQDLAVVPLLSPDSDTDSDSDAHSSDSEPKLVCEHSNVHVNCNEVPSNR